VFISQHLLEIIRRTTPTAYHSTYYYESGTTHGIKERQGSHLQWLASPSDQGNRSNSTEVRQQPEEQSTPIASIPTYRSNQRTILLVAS
jgi:hypothetical protein